MDSAAETILSLTAQQSLLLTSRVWLDFLVIDGMTETSSIPVAEASLPTNTAGETDDTASEPQESIHALLEALTPQQQTEYLQQLYMTTEYSARPVVSVIHVEASENEAMAQQESAASSSSGDRPSSPMTTSLSPDKTKADASYRTAIAVSKRSAMPKRPGPSQTTQVPTPRSPFEKPDTPFYFQPHLHPIPTKPKATQFAHKDSDVRLKIPTGSKNIVTKKPAATVSKKATTKQSPPKRKTTVKHPPPSLNDPIGRGVTMRPSGKWQAQMYFAGKSRYIGVFDSRELAMIGYETAREKLKSRKFTSTQEIERHINAARKAAFQAVEDATKGKPGGGSTGAAMSDAAMTFMAMATSPQPGLGTFEEGSP